MYTWEGGNKVKVNLLFWKKKSAPMERPIDQAIRAVPTQGGRGPASNPWGGTVGQSWGDIAIILSREKGGLFPKPGYATGQKAAVNQF